MNRKYVVYQGRRENESGGVSLGGKKVRGGGECFSPAGGDHRSASTALLPLTFIQRWSIAAKASPSASFPSTLELRSKEKCSDPLPHAGVVVRVGGAFRDSDPGLTLWPVVTSVCPPPHPPLSRDAAAKFQKRVRLNLGKELISPRAVLG